jgi:hypothetical protein
LNINTSRTGEKKDRKMIVKSFDSYRIANHVRASHNDRPIMPRRRLPDEERSRRLAEMQMKVRSGEMQDFNATIHQIATVVSLDVRPNLVGDMFVSTREYEGGTDMRLETTYNQYSRTVKAYSYGPSGIDDQSVKRGENVVFTPEYYGSPNVFYNKRNVYKGDLDMFDEAMETAKFGIKVEIDRDIFRAQWNSITPTFTQETHIVVHPELRDHPMTNYIDASAEGGLTWPLYKRLKLFAKRSNQAILGIAGDVYLEDDIMSWAFVPSGVPGVSIQDSRDIVTPSIATDIQRGGNLVTLGGQLIVLHPSNSLPPKFLYDLYPARRYLFVAYANPGIRLSLWPGLSRSKEVEPDEGNEHQMGYRITTAANVVTHTSLYPNMLVVRIK